MKPLIAIECGHYGEGTDGQFMVREPMIEAVEVAGGNPILLPPSDSMELESVLSLIHGVILTGGDDYCGDAEGEAHPMAIPLTERRLSFSKKLAKACLDLKKPFVSICLGVQSLNVVLGGTLIIDIPEEVPESKIAHRQVLNRSRRVFHEIDVKPNTFFSSLWNESTITVNSCHHQAIKTLAAGFRAGAYAPDGILEAFEVIDHPFGIAVQWHPENMLDDEKQLGIFKSLIQNAG